MGYSYILPSILTKSEGQAIVPITNDKHRPIGQLTGLKMYNSCFVKQISYKI